MTRIENCIQLMKGQTMAAENRQRKSIVGSFNFADLEISIIISEKKGAVTLTAHFRAYNPRWFIVFLNRQLQKISSVLEFGTGYDTLRFEGLSDWGLTFLGYDLPGLNGTTYIRILFNRPVEDSFPRRKRRMLVIAVERFAFKSCCLFFFAFSFWYILISSSS